MIRVQGYKIVLYVFTAPIPTTFLLALQRDTLKEVKWSRHRPGVAHRVGRGIALLFHDRGTRREWVVSSTPWPHFTPGKVPVPILQEAGWVLGPVWTGGKSRPHRDSIPDRPACSQSLYRLSYRAYNEIYLPCKSDEILLHSELMYKIDLWLYGPREALVFVF